MADSFEGNTRSIFVWLNAVHTVNQVTELRQLALFRLLLGNHQILGDHFFECVLG